MQPNTPQNNQYGQNATPGQGIHPVSTIPSEIPHEKASRFLILAAVLLAFIAIGALAFAVISFMQAQDYKKNVDRKVQAAVAVANEKQKKELDAAYAEQEKSPYKTYIAPSQYDSIKIVYPKTWSAQVSEGASGTPLNAYFHPNFIPDTAGKSPIFVRVQLLSSTYSSELAKYKSQVQAGSLKSTVFTPKQVPGVVGVRLTGSFPPDRKGEIIILPVRDHAIKLWTETEAGIADFEKIVLENLSFTP